MSFLLLMNTCITFFSSEIFLVGWIIDLLKQYLSLITFPFYFRIFLFFILFFNFLCSYSYEKYIIKYFEKREIQKKYNHNHMSSIFCSPQELDTTNVFVTCN
ncbi:hypothetical protein PFLG_00566 [Plasmodium falciparum RAJ116]|nr:hypothetical protein PFLG_00566 [Plasmodium falciparum RAJ116]